MKGLLHSKRFKEKLYRWLFMYVGVLGLLTTVITYSKYITKLAQKDENARTAIFKADIIYTDSEGNPCEGSGCTTGVYRPTSEIKYYFKLDTDFEVLTDLFLTVKIATKDDNVTYEDFKIISIRNVTKNEEVLVNGKIKTLEIENQYDPVTDKITSPEDIYEVIVKYDGEITSDSVFSKEAKPVIEIGYTAEQRNS